MAGTAENLLTAQQQAIFRNDCGTVHMVSADSVEDIHIGQILQDTAVLDVAQCILIANACQHS